MIVDLLELEDESVMTADVAIVGTGIAGAEIATFLIQSGFKVILLESGRESFDPEIQSLNHLHFSAKPHRPISPDASYHRYLAPALRGSSRIRQLGGTSNIWTGKWKQLQESDTAERHWLPSSEWPLDFEEIRSYYRETAMDYELGDLESEQARPRLRKLGAALARDGLKVSSFYWQRRPLRTRNRFRSVMQKSEDLRVVLGATVTEIVLDETFQRVSHVRCSSLEGRRLTTQAKIFVLATGALEAPRLLLASNRQISAGIGNANDLVGRYYTDHLKHHEGFLKPGQLARNHATELQRRPKPRYSICFALDNNTQSQNELLEHSVYLKPIYSDQSIIGLDTDGSTCRDEIGLVDYYRVKLATEQVPNLHSRITLSSQRDRLGVPMIDLAWRFTDQDHMSLARIVELITDRFQRSGLGLLDFGSDPPVIDSMTDAAHQMGTTRMAYNAKQGVINPDCRVFGTENLFIAGSSVFPTCPSYSPTFTILALSRRLGRHISSLLRKNSGFGFSSTLFP